MEVQFGSVACTRTPANRGTQASERLGLPLRFNHSVTVCFSRAGDKTIPGREMFLAPLVFPDRKYRLQPPPAPILNIDRFRSSPVARGVSVLPFAWANPNPPSLSATSEPARHQM